MSNIFERMKAGELILESDPEYQDLYKEFERGMSIVGELNSSYHSPEEIRTLLSRLTKKEIDSSVRMFLPFYTAFGQFITLGKNVFINSSCTFLDRGGITIDDDVFIGPNVSLITENHPEEPEIRHNVYGRPIHIKRNAWIGAGAIILPGVTVGCNAIVGAGAVVTKDVEDNTIVVGNPAHFLRYIRQGKSGK